MEPRGCNRLQPAAISRPSKPQNKRNPLRPAATGCVVKYMVRRGSATACMTCVSLAHKLAHHREATPATRARTAV